RLGDVQHPGPLDRSPSRPGRRLRDPEQSRVPDPQAQHGHLPPALRRQTRPRLPEHGSGRARSRLRRPRPRHGSGGPARPPPRKTLPPPRQTPRRPPPLPPRHRDRRTPRRRGPSEPLEERRVTRRAAEAGTLVEYVDGGARPSGPAEPSERAVVAVVVSGS